MNIGNLQRRWSPMRPQVYEKATRLVALDIMQESQKDDDGNEQQGYSYIQVEIDSQIDYGHIKSQLIEAGFPQKDEFGLLMNAVDNILTAVEADSYKAFKAALDTEAIKKFGDFCAFRAMCAEAAKEVMNQY